MKSILKMAMFAAVCSAATVMAEPLKIDSKFTVNEKNELKFWGISGKHENVTLEAVESSDKQGHAAFLETAERSVPLAYRGLFRIDKYKELTFSVGVRGNGGFAVQLHLYNEKDRYVTCRVLLEGRGAGDVVKTYTGKVEVPQEVNGQKIRYGRVHLLSFKNTQLVYENATLDGELR